LAIKTSRPTVVALLIFFSISIHLHAEEYRLGEIFAGYSLLHGDLQKRASGWEISGGAYFNRWFSLHADFDAHHQSAAGSLRHQHDFLFGPQFSHRTGNFTLFAHALRAEAIQPAAFAPRQGLHQLSAEELIGILTLFSRFVSAK
jgi:hypothetical protein